MRSSKEQVITTYLFSEPYLDLTLFSMLYSYLTLFSELYSDQTLFSMPYSDLTLFSELCSDQGVEHLHLRGLRKSLPNNPSLLHKVALLLRHASLPIWHSGPEKYSHKLNLHMSLPHICVCFDKFVNIITTHPFCIWWTSDRVSIQKVCRPGTPKKVFFASS